MDDFSTKAGVANIYGVGRWRGERDPTVERMLSSMSPTILLLENNEVRMVIGTPGRSTIFLPPVFFKALSSNVVIMVCRPLVSSASRFHHQVPGFNYHSIDIPHG
jgi:gamma-glutamyltranspeptidase/glutathione hydrolase